MTKQEFEATEGLLHDVMRKQAGSVEKAVLEAVMNSVDAGATEIDISIYEDGMKISDDGKGMTEEEIQEYFQKFGLKDDDIEEKEFGKFRMGRGQIFNFGRNIWHTKENILIVNLDEDETTVHLEDDGPHGGTVTLDTSGLSYNLLDRETGPIDGCEIDVKFYEELDDVDSTVDEIENLIEFIPWLHNVQVWINGDEVQNEIVMDHETDNAYFAFKPEESIGNLPNWTHDTAIYNKGAYVKRESLVPLGSVIISKDDLDVNFSRNDIIDTDGYWKEIKQEFLEAAKEYLLEKRDLNARESKWLLKEAATDDALIKQLASIPLIEDIKNNMWSIKELDGEDISFSHGGDKAAKDIMESTGVLFIKESYSDVLHNLVEESNVLAYDDVLEQHNTFEMSKIDEDDLSKKRRERLSMIRWFLTQVGCTETVESGFSKHADAWKDGEGTIYVHKGLLNQSKTEFLTTGLEKVLEVAAHDGDTRQGRDHSGRFRRNYWNYSKRKPEALKELLNGNADYEDW